MHYGLIAFRLQKNSARIIPSGVFYNSAFFVIYTKINIEYFFIITFLFFSFIICIFAMDNKQCKNT